MTTSPAPSVELAKLEARAELDKFARLGMWLAAAEAKDPNPEQKGAAAALRLYYAQALDLTPMAAAELSIIGGRLVIGAQLLRAMAGRAGYRVVRGEDADDQSCTATLIDTDTGEVVGSSTFTLEDARRAGLIRDRSAWQTHPARMLWARASALVVKDYAPEVSLGMVTPEEAAEIDAVPAQLPDDTDVIDGEATDADADTPSDTSVFVAPEAEQQTMDTKDDG